MKFTGLYIGNVSSPMKCIRGKRYVIIAEDKHNTYRVIDETGEDYLYSKSSFTDIQEEAADKEMAAAISA
jgi:hypothetical protein